MNTLTFDRDNFYLNGEPFRIIAGDIHYFRIHPNDWEKRLDLAVDFGLNTIQTYVPWNSHEPKENEYDFDGMLDIGAFLRLCHKKGLKVLLRPSPFICSEWDLGGLPSRLLKDRELVIRSSDPKYLAHVKRYYSHLIPQFLPYLSTKGGPIIAVALENEYGSYGNDHQYMDALANYLREGGVDVPFYTTDGGTPIMLNSGTYSGAFCGINFRAMPGIVEDRFAAYQNFGCDNPFFIGEFWAGRSMHWGEPFHHRPPAETSEAFREALEAGGHVCFYMFSGGTNYGFMGGADLASSFSPRPGTPPRYIPHTTSYDVDALISEDGTPTEKYYLCRDVLDAYLGKPQRPHTKPHHATQAFTVPLSQSAAMFENLDALTETYATATVPKPMEDYGQSYGLILYSTKLDGFANPPDALYPRKFRDRATVFVDGEWFATYMRDRGVRAPEGVETTDTGRALLAGNGTQRKIDVLVENTGRINHGSPVAEDRKGLEDAIYYAYCKLFGYETRTLPLSDLTHLDWKVNDGISPHKPYFFKGHFNAESGIDTYISFAEFGHGYIWINGFNLGRYDSAGPQMTLYLPGHFLKDTDNEIIVLDLDPTKIRAQIHFLDHEILEGESSELS